MINWITRHWLWFDPSSKWCDMRRGYERHCACWEQAMAALDAMVWASGEVAKAATVMLGAMENMAQSFAALTGAEEENAPST